MKKNSKVVAFVLTLTLLLTTGFPVFAADGVINGDSDVNNVTINVILPTNLNFALDPLGLEVTEGNQISTLDYFFVNQTLAPVKVALDITATTSNGAVLTSSTGALSKDDTTVTDKMLYFGALGATGLTGTAIAATGSAVTTSSATNVITTYSAIGDIYGSTNPPKAEYATVSAVAPTQVTFTPNSDGTTGSALISFALGKAIESATPGVISTLASDNDGVAAFQFYSELNTYADWKANDITVTGTYTLTPLRGTTYDSYVSSDMITGSLNQLEPEVTTPETTTYSAAGFITTGSYITTTTHAAITHVSSSAVNLVIPFYANGLTVTSLTSNTTYSIPTTQYAISVANNTLTINSDNALDWLRAAGVGTKLVTITLSNSSTYTFDLIQQ